MPVGEQFRRFYPGLIRGEAEVWRAWLREHESEYEAFEYNVHVGEGVNIAPAILKDNPELQEKMRLQFLRATQRKIDVVGYREGVVWIFEVEEEAGTTALGQLLTYRLLLTLARDIRGTVELAIVAATIGRDMLEVFDEAGVVVWQRDA